MTRASRRGGGSSWGCGISSTDDRERKPGRIGGPSYRLTRRHERESSTRREGTARTTERARVSVRLTGSSSVRHAADLACLDQFSEHEWSVESQTILNDACFAVRSGLPTFRSAARRAIRSRRLLRPPRPRTSEGLRERADPVPDDRHPRQSGVILNGVGVRGTALPPRGARSANTSDA